MMEAPALKASRASAAIWAGVTGTGCCFGSVSTPVSAQVRMALSCMLTPYVASRQSPRGGASASGTAQRRSFLNLQFDHQRAGGNGFALARMHSAHRAGGACAEPHLHLHRLHAEQRLAFGDLVARLHEHLGDDA